MCEYFTSQRSRSFTEEIFAILIAGYFLQSVTMASGLIRWHWLIVHDWPPIEARLWLQGEEWRFWLRWFWFGLAAFLLGLVVCLTLTHLLETFASNAAEQHTDLYSTLAVLGSLAVGTALTAWWFPRNFLSLAAIAVREDSTYRQKAKHYVDRADCARISLASLLTAVPTLLVSQTIYMPLHPTPLEDGRIEHSIASIAGAVASCSIDLLALIIFATMLSLFYRELVTAPDQAASAP